MKVSEQQKAIRSHFAITNHTFFNMIAAAIQAELGRAVDMPVRLTGKASNAGKISAVIIGQTPLLDEAAYEQAKVRVDEFMQKLRNPSNLMSLLK